MRKIKILIVDDAVVFRKMLSETMSQDPEIEVVGVASNGKLALKKLELTQPDIISLDVEMPEMDGLECLHHIRQKYPDLPVIMFSMLTQKGGQATLEALSRGATDYVPKPTKAGSLAEGIERIKDSLIPKVKALCHVQVGQPIPRNMPQPKPVVETPNAPHQAAAVKRFHRVDVVVLGISTGGPNALSEMMPQFPENFPVPIVVVQHMPPNFTKLLADRLNLASTISITEAREGDILMPGHAYIAPGDFHIVLEQDRDDVRIRTNQDPPENSCRPAVDPLFRSAARVFGRNTLAVVMTGMGQDGMKGCEAIQSRSGQVLVQDEATSVVWGMPGFVTKARLADKVLPLNAIANEIIEKCHTGRLSSLLKSSPTISPT